MKAGRKPEGLVLSAGGGVGAEVFDSVVCLGAGRGASPHVLSC